jgi:glycine hydroxymethyltransferase
MWTSSYKSDINYKKLDGFFVYINQIVNLYKSFINSYTTSLVQDDVMEAASSPLSCFFNEYLARKFNQNHSAVSIMEKYFNQQLEEKFLLHFKQPLKVIFNITSCTYAIVCSLLTVIKPNDKVMVLDSCCGGYWSQGSSSLRGLRGFPSLLFEITTFHLENGTLDYYLLEKHLIREKPQCLLLGFSSYTQPVDYKKIRQLCDENHCFFIFDGAHTIGLMVGGIIENSFFHSHITVGSTYKTIKGHRGGIMITPHEEYINNFNQNLTSIQVERGLNLVAANYIAISHCFQKSYGISMNKSIAIAQQIYNYFNKESWALFNIKPLTKTNVPMVLLDLGFDGSWVIETLLECGWHCSGFPIHNKYIGLRIITTNMEGYGTESINNLLELLKIILLNKNLNWSSKEKIKKSIKSIVLSNNKPLEVYYDHDTLAYINSMVKKQNKRLIFSTCSLFTDVCLKLQGHKLMTVDLDYFSNKDDHPSSPWTMKRKIQEKTGKHIKQYLQLPYNIYANYNIPSAGAAILSSLLTLAQPQDKILIVAENNGGHYTQGSQSGSGAVGLPKTLFNVKEFFINEQLVFDYDILENNLKNFQPKVLLLGFSSYTGLLNYKKIRELCDQYHCLFISDCSHTIGLMINGFIPHCFEEAHITLASTYKTIPAVRGGLMITKHFNILKEFQKKSAIICAERGLNLMAAMAMGIEECMTLGYKKKMNRSWEIAKLIERFFMENNLGRPTVPTQIHMATIDTGWDIREVFAKFMECNLDIGTFYVPHTDRYGLRFICTTVGILDYSDEDILKTLQQIALILINKNNLTQQQMEIIGENIVQITNKYPMYTTY